MQMTSKTTPTIRPEQVSLQKDARVLFLTKDLDLIKRQLNEGLRLKMSDVDPKDLLDDINTDVMTPAWVCFDYKPDDIAKNAYAGLISNHASGVSTHKSRHVDAEGSQSLSGGEREMDAGTRLRFGRIENG